MSGPAGRAAALTARIPDALPLLALAAAALAQLVPFATIAARVDVLLAGLVLVTALDIDPAALLAVRARWRLVLMLSTVPLGLLALGGWGLAQLVHGASRTGVLALGLSPTEVASVGLIGLLGGPAEVAIAVLACSLVLSAVAGPPLLSLLADARTGHAAHVLPLLGRFGLVVIVPLIAGLVVRAARPQVARAEGLLAALSSLLVVVLVYASLSDTGSGGGLGGAAAISAAFLAIGIVLAGALAAAGVLGDGVARGLGLTVGMRDFAVAAALASAAGGAAAAHVAGIYGVLMLIAGAGITGFVRARERAVGGIIEGR